MPKDRCARFCRPHSLRNATIIHLVVRNAINHIIMASLICLLWSSYSLAQDIKASEKDFLEKYSNMLTAESKILLLDELRGMRRPTSFIFNVVLRIIEMENDADVLFKIADDLIPEIPRSSINLLPELKKRYMESAHSKDTRFGIIYVLSQISQIHDGNSNLVLLSEVIEDALESESNELLVTTVLILQKIKPPQKQFGPKLLELLKTTEYVDVKLITLVTLGMIEAENSLIQEAFIFGLTHDSDKVKEWASFASIQVQNPSQEFFDALVSVLDSDSNDAWNRAIRTLARLSSDHLEPILERLVSILEAEGSTSIKAGAAYALGRIGPDAERAIPMLLHCIRNASVPSIVSACAAAAGNISPGEEVLNALIMAFDRQNNIQVKAQLLVSLGATGPQNAAKTLSLGHVPIKGIHESAAL